MYPYRRLLIGLNLSSQDETTLRYAAMMSRLAPAERAYLTHVAENFDVPDEIRTAFPETVQPADEVICEQLERAAAEFFVGSSSTERVFEATEGNVAVELLRRAVRKGVDLLVVGSRQRERGGGTVPEKLARKAPCSVLVVPEGARPRLRRLLVPIDFSEHAADALEVALSIAHAAGADEVLPLHVYNVPLGYYKIGKSFEEFAEIMRGHAEAKYERFLSGVELRGVRVTPRFVLDERPAQGVRKALQAQEVDLVVMGARGRTNSAAVLLGSVTERVLHDTEVPLLAVKRKDDTMNLLEAILQV